MLVQSLLISLRASRCSKRLLMTIYLQNFTNTFLVSADQRQNKNEREEKVRDFFVFLLRRAWVPSPAARRKENFVMNHFESEVSQFLVGVTREKKSFKKNFKLFIAFKIVSCYFYRLFFFSFFLCFSAKFSKRKKSNFLFFDIFAWPIHEMWWISFCRP